MTDLIGQNQAIATLDSGRAEIMASIDKLPAGSGNFPGVGGGTWSPKDLLGHLESWQEHVLDALDAWSRAERAPVDVALYGEGLNALNAREVERKAGRSFEEQLAAAAATHDRLRATIRAIDEEAWNSPATRRARRPLGHRLGQILLGTKEPFEHDGAHLKALRQFLVSTGVKG